jgi:hypothetical protein
MEKSSDEPEPAEHSFDTGRAACIHNVSFYKHSLQVFILSVQKRKLRFSLTIFIHDSWTNLNGHNVLDL